MPWLEKDETAVHYVKTKKEARLLAERHQDDVQRPIDHTLVYGPDKFSCRDCGLAWKWTEK